MEGRVGIASIGAVLALVLQVVLAPNIALGGVMPNFVIAYVVALSMLLTGTSMYVVAFALGMLCDLLGYGPVGALPFILLVVSFLIEHAQKTFGNGTLFVSCAIVVVFTIIVHFLHAGFMVAITSTYTIADAFFLVAIPGSLYDSVLAVVIYMLLRRMIVPPQSHMAQIGPLAR